jgi:hypothetical protein
MYFWLWLWLCMSTPHHQCLPVVLFLFLNVGLTTKGIILLLVSVSGKTNNLKSAEALVMV